MDELTELTGVVEYITFLNEENGYTVLEISSGGELYTAAGGAGTLYCGEKVTLIGRWMVHPTFGKQFKIESCRREIPETAGEMLSYLSSGMIKGVKEKTAQKIVERFGEETFYIIEHFPDRLAEIKGISKDRAKEISREFVKNAAEREALIALEKYGMTASECLKAYRVFGARSVETIERNPYTLCGSEIGVPFEKASEIASKLPSPPAPEYRIDAGIIYVVRHNCNMNGHTCLPREKLFAPCLDLLGCSRDEIDIRIDKLVDGKFLVSHNVGGREYIFLPEMYKAERNAAEMILFMKRFATGGDPRIDEQITNAELISGVCYNELQKKAIKLAVEKGILILTGGPGAIFWMWVIAFFGMATIYAEAVLAQKTRIKGEDGQIKGGPVYYITTAFKGGFGKFLAGFFAIAIILALGFFGCMVQSNSIGSTCSTAFGIPSWVMGAVLVAICGFIFLGGVQRLASVTEKIVPIMAAIFLVGGLAILIARIKYVPATFGMIFKYAFKPQAIIGGSFGAALKIALSQGAKRGLFSNEAGMGSTPHAHALANVAEPHDQGCVAMIGVFIDTFVVLTLNSLVIISTMYTPDGVLANGYMGAVVDTIGKANLAQTAFGTVFGANFGNMFVAICLFFFAFSTILGWNLFGKINMQYLFGDKSYKIYTVIALVFIFLGTLASNDLVWELSDMFNQLMVIPNVIALFALTKMVQGCTKGLKK